LFQFYFSFISDVTTVLKHSNLILIRSASVMGNGRAFYRQGQVERSSAV